MLRPNFLFNRIKARINTHKILITVIVIKIPCVESGFPESLVSFVTVDLITFSLSTVFGMVVLDAIVIFVCVFVFVVFFVV